MKRFIPFLFALALFPMFLHAQGGRSVITPTESSRSVITNDSSEESSTPLYQGDDDKPLWQRIQEEKEAQERAEKEKAEQERLEKERLAREKFVADSLEQVRIANEKAELERQKKEQAEREKLEKERLAREKYVADSLEQVRLANEKAELERQKKEQAEREKLEKERLAREKFVADSLEQIRIANEKAELVRQKKLQAEEKKRKKEEWIATIPKSNFFLLNGAYSSCPQYSFGLTYGHVKRLGWYANVMSNFGFTFSSDYESDANGCINGEYPFYSGNHKATYLSASVGAVVRLHIPVYLYGGVGYGYRSVFYELATGEWTSCKTETASSHGLHWEAGLLCNIKGFALSGGISSSTNFDASFFETKIGVGCFINKK